MNEQNSIILNQIFLKLRKRTETASKLLIQSGGLDVLEYSLALTESVLEALDAAMCYPSIDILENLMGVVEIEKKQY